MCRDAPIAVFDSGIGGLTVFKAIKELLPGENLLCLADLQRMPYGNRDCESIIQYTKEALHFLEKQNVKLIVFACHTVSTVSSELICPIPMMNVLQAGIKTISPYQKIAILGTQRTIQSGIYEKSLHKLYPQMEILSIPCPKLALAIETQNPQIEEVTKEYIKPLKNIDAVFLACTHYPLIRPIFEKLFCQNVAILDPSKRMAEEVKEFLIQNDLFSTVKLEDQFYVTGREKEFASKASKILGEKVQAKLVNLVEENVSSKYKIELMSSKARIIMIEDEEDIAALIKMQGEISGYKVQVIGDGIEGYAAVVRDKPDLVILDVMLPGENGLDVCRKIKGNPETKNIPVIILSARGEEIDVVLGLELGADDYVPKPFSPKVLFSRVKAVLRRGKEGETPISSVKFGDFILDIERYHLRLKDKSYPLTLSEFGILRKLVSNRGKVLTRNQLLSDICEDAGIVDRNIDVHIASLRKKLGPTFDWIETVRGVGYRFREEAFN